MTTREKHIEYSSNVVRTLNPSSPPPLSPSSHHHGADFDNKIDYLLEDLQQSVSRPGSSLGYNSSSNFSTLNNRDVQYFSSPNSTSKVIRERSVSPTSGRRTFKTSKYEYSTSNSGGANTKLDADHSINQLDSLLDELKTERELAIEKNNASNISSGLDSGLLEPGHKSRIVQSSYTSKSSSSNLKPTLARELKFDSSNVESETTRTREMSPGYKKIIESTTTKNVNYEPYVPEKLESSSMVSTINRTSTNQRTKSPLPVHETVSVDTIDNHLDLSGIPLESNILPTPGTKVTTTVRTYTYEIPAERSPPVNQSSVVYKTTSQSNTLRNGTLDRNRPERDVPTDTIIYRNDTYNNQNTTNHFLPDGRYPEHDRPISPRPPTKNVTYIQETYNTTNTVNEMDRPEMDRPFPVETIPLHQEPPVNKSVIYKRTTRDTTSSSYPGQQRPLSPTGYPRDNNPPETRIVYNENITNNTNNVVHPGGPNYPPPGHPNGPKTTYYYKHESTNTTNRRYGPPGSANPRNEPLAPAILPVDGYPNEPGNVSYKYTTHTTSRNVNRGPDETDALMKPAPFPTDMGPPYGNNGAPPKRLDDLLATFDDTPQKKVVYQDRNLLPEKPYTSTVDSLVETANADQKVPSKNVAGPPVYYPPGEMFTRKEEGAGWKAQGGYAKGSGKYMHEADGKSKSKSSGGAAMVPVCLPLCCAMPCSIM